MEQARAGRQGCHNAAESGRTDAAHAASTIRATPGPTLPSSARQQSLDAWPGRGREKEGGQTRWMRPPREQIIGWRVALLSASVDLILSCLQQQKGELRSRGPSGAALPGLGSPPAVLCGASEHRLHAHARPAASAGHAAAALEAPREPLCIAWRPGAAGSAGGSRFGPHDAAPTLASEDAVLTGCPPSAAAARQENAAI